MTYYNEDQVHNAGYDGAGAGKSIYKNCIGCGAKVDYETKQDHTHRSYTRSKKEFCSECQDEWGDQVSDFIQGMID